MNPSNGAIIWQGNAAGSADVNNAVKAARDAHRSWSSLKHEARIEYLKRFRQLLSERKNKFALLISDETGKLLWECKSEVGAMIAKLDNSLKAFEMRCAEQSFSLNDEVKADTHFKSHGVMAVLGPFNFPGHLPNGHIMPAFIAGNTVVFKPSELTPKVGEEIVRLWQEVSLPKGVINLIQGDGLTGKRLVEHNDVDAVCIAKAPFITLIASSSLS